jgi:hypothetical protein
MFRRARLDMPGVPHQILVRGINRPRSSSGADGFVNNQGGLAGEYGKGENEFCKLEEKFKGFAAGGVNYISKPFHHEKVLT